jgi:hypothetical protein
MKKALLSLCLSLSGAFFVPTLTHAATDPIIQQLTTTTESTLSGTSATPWLFIQEVGFVPGAVTQVQAYLKQTGSSPGNAIMMVYNCPNNDWQSCIEAGSGLTYRHVPVEGSITPSSTESLSTWTYTDTVTSTYVFLRWNISAQTNRVLYTLGTPQDYFAERHCQKYNTIGIPLADCPSIDSWYYQIWTNQPIVPQQLLANGLASGGLVINLPPTSTSITTACPDLGLFTPLCDGVIWFFVPDTSTLGTTVSTTVGLFTSRFPFSYIYSLNDAIQQGITTTTQTALSISWDPDGVTSTLPQIGAGFSPITISFATSTWMDHAGGVTLWHTFRYWLGIMMYIGTAASIFDSLMGSSVRRGGGSWLDGIKKGETKDL